MPREVADIGLIWLGGVLVGLMIGLSIGQEIIGFVSAVTP